jgi:hypothetical protein
MSALALPVEFGPVSCFVGETVQITETPTTGRTMDPMVRRGTLGFFQYQALAGTSPTGIGISVEAVPSAVEINWYNYAISSLHEVFSTTGDMLAGFGLVGSGGTFTQKLLSLTGGSVALIVGTSGVEPAPHASQYSSWPAVLAPIGGTSTALADLTRNFLPQIGWGPALAPFSYEVVRVSASAGVGYTITTAHPVHSGLGDRIRAVYESTTLDEDALELARRAVNDAIAFVDYNLPEGTPIVMLSDDGVLTLQWRLDDRGVMIVFTGDGTGTYSIKEPAGYYAVGAKEFSLVEGLDEQIRAAIHNAQAVA